PEGDLRLVRLHRTSARLDVGSSLLLPLTNELGLTEREREMLVLTERHRLLPRQDRHRRTLGHLLEHVVCDMSRQIQCAGIKDCHCSLPPRVATPGRTTGEQTLCRHCRTDQSRPPPWGPP